MQINFEDLKVLAKSISCQLDLSKLVSDLQVNDMEQKESPLSIEAIDASNKMYDVLHLYIELLKEIYNSRPLPF